MEHQRTLKEYRFVYDDKLGSVQIFKDYPKTAHDMGCRVLIGIRDCNSLEQFETVIKALGRAFGIKVRSQRVKRQ